MGHRIFLAGASGAIGQPLSRLLAEAGHQVAGTTRSSRKADRLRALGVEPVIVDVFDPEALQKAVSSARPEIVIHQLTDLPEGLDPALMEKAAVANARIREEGTRNLVAAAIAVGARRLIAQSIAWAYAPGAEPHREDDPLDSDAVGRRAVSVRGVIALEERTLNSPPLEGVVLRYGQLYGPGTGFDAPGEASPVHVDAAAHAALLAMDRTPGIFNIAEPNPHVATGKAREVLGWDPDFRLPSETAGRMAAS
jgi:nucleoside-diphosphate-sugar epimerase